MLLHSTDEVTKTQRDKRLSLPVFLGAGTTFSYTWHPEAQLILLSYSPTLPIISPLFLLLFPSLVPGFLGKVKLTGLGLFVWIHLPAAGYGAHPLLIPPLGHLPFPSTEDWNMTLPLLFPNINVL